MTRRITVPDGHVAVILPNQLADESAALCQIIRRAGKTLSFTFNDAGKSATKEIASDLLLAILDAKEV